MARRLGNGMTIEAIQLENIYAAAESLTLSKDEASGVVGGKGRLMNLIAQGKIRALKGANSQNSRWRCNAADVLRHCRCLLK